ncbi:MAG TPA: hypothetical protein VNF68_13250 [Candidatus Baltobacteraceae bacterium]|nr:hypothetical protein [Candidatus Baltobacteraceae bacterium]
MRGFPKRSAASTTVLFKPGEDAIRRLGYAAPGVAEEMAVALEHHASVGVAHTARDCERIFARYDGQRVGRVAQTMERNVGQFRYLEQRLEDPTDEVALAQRGPVGRREDEAVLRPAFGLVRQERLERERGKIETRRDFAVFGSDRTSLPVQVLGQGRADRDSASVEVYIVPARRLPHARRDGESQERPLLHVACSAKQLYDLPAVENQCLGPLRLRRRDSAAWIAIDLLFTKRNVERV